MNDLDIVMSRVAAALNSMGNFAAAINLQISPLIKEIGRIIMPDTLEAVILEKLQKFMLEEPIAFYDLVMEVRRGNWADTRMLYGSKKKIAAADLGDLDAKIKFTISPAVKTVVRKYVRGRGVAFYFVEVEME